MRFRKACAVTLGIGLLLSVQTAHAQENLSEFENSLGLIDWIVVALYGFGMLAVGIYYSIHTKTSEEYYLGGRTMRPSLVGLSLFATLISTISYLAVPGEMIKSGPIYLSTILAIPIVFLVVGFLIIPYLTRLPITSAYEILENRFGRGVRLLGCLTFLMIRFVWMGLVTLTASRIVAAASGLGDESVPYIAFVVGAVTVIYSSIGGLRAVVITDVIQTAILFLGAFIAVVLVSVKMGGISWFPTHWASNWDTQPLYSFNPAVRATVLGQVLTAGFWWICTATSDQMAVQRYLATRDTKAARRAFLVNNIADASVSLLLGLLGFALLGFFRTHPEYLTENLNLETRADYLFPYFIVKFFGYGLAGLVISGMLAAAMSSLASGVNSVGTVINTDLIVFMLRRSLSEAQKVRLAKITCLAVGVVVVLLSFVVAKVHGNLLEVTCKTSNLLVGPLFGLFFFALFMPSATAMGAVLGSFYGFITAFFLAFADSFGYAPISFQWILPGSVLVNIAAGGLFSMLPVDRFPSPLRVCLGLLLVIPGLLILLMLA